MKIFQILAVVSEQPPVSQTTGFLYAREEGAFYLIFKRHVSETLSCLQARCQISQFTSKKLFWREKDRLVPVPGSSFSEVKAAPILHWWTFRKASSHLGVFVPLHSDWRFCWSQRWLASLFHNTEVEKSVFKGMKTHFYHIWQRWVYIFIQIQFWSAHP